MLSIDKSHLLVFCLLLAVLFLLYISNVWINVSVMSCIVYLLISVLCTIDSPSIHFCLIWWWKLPWELDLMFGHVIGSSSSAAPAGINRNSVRSHRSSLYHTALTVLLIDCLISCYLFTLLYYCLWQNLKNVTTFCRGSCLPSTYSWHSTCQLLDMKIVSPLI